MLAILPEIDSEDFVDFFICNNLLVLDHGFHKWLM